MELSPNYRFVGATCARTIVVGDIHGCGAEFDRLLTIVGFHSSDVLVTVGDFLDRGPDSWKVATILRDTPNCFSVIGNHERRVAGTIRGTSRPAWSQRQTLAALPRADWEYWASWLESLPAVIETPHAIIAHARLDPNIGLPEQDPYFTAAVGGSAVQIDLDDSGVPLWFQKSKAEKPICIGHIAYIRDELVPGRLYALDTGAAKKGALTAITFPQRKIIKVLAAKNYYEESRAQWRRTQLEEELAGGQLEDKAIARLLEIANEFGDSNEGMISALRRWLHDLNGTLDLSGLIELVHERFGSPPTSGVERQAYFVRVAGSFTDPVERWIVTRLLAGKPLRIEEFASRFHKQSFQALATATAAVRAFLATPARW